MCALNMFKEKYFIIKQSLYEKVYNYILNEDYINIEGFVKFRMKEFNNYISTIVDLAWEEYFIKKTKMSLSMYLSILWIYSKKS